tara:strand:- start:1935 stop:2903 length:969 start_codon:yes stop_codon:yes gene_type:complete
MHNYIAVTIGDINGIGIKILIDLWKKNKIKNFILFTDILILRKYLKKEKYNIQLNIINKNMTKSFNNKKLNVYNYKSSSLVDNTYKSLKYSYQFCKKNICIGMITLPIRKDLIIKKVNKRFVGHTEYFQKLDKKEYSNMILFHKKIIITTLTTHISVKQIANKISNKNYLMNQIINLHKTLKIDFNIEKPRLIISGLNPHAGEKGNLGNEEIKYILPIIKKLKNKVNISGPVSPDAMLIKKNLNNYDCFIFIYHDQALIPFKFISQFSGVNYTGNLDIIRTSPDHGTAYNLKKDKNFSNKSLINCYNLVKLIYKNRIMNAKS